MLLAIFYQESSLLSDPQGCLNRKIRCTGDYGIGQINYKVWGKRFNLDKVKLMTNVPYAVKMSTKVFVHYKLRYQHKELHWYTRYHSGTPSLRAKYLTRINKGFSKINLYLQAHRNAKKELTAMN